MAVRRVNGTQEGVSNDGATDYFDEDADIDDETNQRILKGIEDVKAGKHRPLREIGKEMGI